jgi:hypothetical protein
MCARDKGVAVAFDHRIHSLHGFGSELERVWQPDDGASGRRVFLRDHADVGKPFTEEIGALPGIFVSTRATPSSCTNTSVLPPPPKIL